MSLLIFMCCNNIQLTFLFLDASSMSMVGLALFPDVASTFNHSCDPNTFVVDVGQVFIPSCHPNIVVVHVG